MSDSVSVSELRNYLVEQGFSPEDPRITAALRKAVNSGGCEHCGARTKMAVPVNPKKPEGPHKLACCARKVD